MESYSDPWKRIELVMETFAKTKIVSEFARELGLNRSENLYQIKRGNNSISMALAEKIQNRYPQLSKSWLLTGEGAYCRAGDLVTIPIYSHNSKRSWRDPESKVQFEMVFNNFTQTDLLFGLQVSDNSMFPDIKPGAFVLFGKEVSVPVYGRIYLIETYDYSLIRLVRDGGKDGTVSLMPVHYNLYDSIKCRISDIERMYPLSLVVWNGNM